MSSSNNSGSPIMLLPASRPPSLPPKHFELEQQFEEELYENPDTHRKKGRSKLFMATCCIVMTVATVIMFLLYFSLIRHYHLDFSEHDCSPGYMYFGETGFCYKISVVPMFFDDAKHLCWSENGDLVSIHSQKETDFIVDLYNKTLATYRKETNILMERSSVWIGLIYTKGDWQWTDGSQTDFVNWAKGEPNSLQKFDFWTVLETEKWKDYNPNGDKWNNVHSHDGKGVVCKKASNAGARSDSPLETTEKQNKCGLGFTWFEKTRHCYKASVHLVNIETASDECDSLGAHLTSIHSSEENQFVLKLYLDTLATYRRQKNILTKSAGPWIGLDNLNDTWSDGSKVDYTNWDAGIFYDNQTAAYIDIGDAEYKWFAAHGDQVHTHRSFVCKKPDSDSAAKYNECSKGYKFYEPTGFCYKVHSTRLVSKGAEKECRKEGAHLASIHSEQENVFLADLSRSSNTTYPESDYVKRLNQFDEVWIGLEYVNNPWKWTDGTDAEFSNWGDGEPNRMDLELGVTLVTSKIEGLNPNGNRWNNVPNFGQQRAFICKKTAIL